MEQEMQVYQDQPIDLVMRRKPDEVIREARTAATALMEIIKNKPKSVKFNGEVYLEFEDWQLLGRFYNVSVKVIRTDEVMFSEDVQGFEAEAVAIHHDQEISGAVAMCLNDERNWKDKPLFQLRSMAQTRACAKAFRNVLGWVAVLGGCKPTPAEEMEEVAYAKPIESRSATKIKSDWKSFGEAREQLKVSKDDAEKFIHDQFPNKAYQDITPVEIGELVKAFREKFKGVAA